MTLQPPHEIYRYLAEAADALTTAELCLMSIDVVTEKELYITQIKTIKGVIASLMSYYLQDVVKPLGEGISNDR